MPTIGSIVNFLQAEDSLYPLVEKAVDVPISGPAGITDAEGGEFSFCTARVNNSPELLAETHASLLIVDRKISIDETSLAQSGVRAVILSDNARLDFIRVMEHFFAQPRPSGIHPSAVVAPSATIGQNVFIGPFCTIQEYVEINAGTVIYAGVHIYEKVRIGRNVTIHSGTVIGKDGWGYERNKLDKLERFPHVGSVEIGDDVEIGGNVSIDRGSLGKTVIRDGCKINNGTHIGHNVEIGEDTIILPQAYLGGSSKVGPRCWIGPHAIVRNRIKIGSD
ncbi:MAG: UDP-3-O-(3-hydroxymyristoyl)glucosamine N-acyltransferase, partial [Candidatus Hermodarchaeia archaeon]